MTKAYIGTGISLLVYFAAAWLIAPVLGLQGSDVWVLRGGLALIGILAAVVFLWSFNKISKQKEGAVGVSGASGRGDVEIETLLRDAEARLKGSNLGRTASLKTLPVFFVLGDAGTTKTSTLIHSGLDAELVAGQVFHENELVSTRSANVWLARNSVIIEAGSETAANPRVWSRVLRRIQSGMISSIRTDPAPRAAIVCVSCDVFLQEQSSEAIASTVRGVRARLDEAARSLGISFPVYVLFTKTDRIPFFAEFVGNLTNEEAKQVLGVTLPMRSTDGTGVWAEQEAKRLNAAFNDLILSLADRRLDFLPREHDSTKLGGLYEFPRELRKLRSPLVQFLVELCKPSQLRATPFLRGFYFSGVRAVIINEVARPAAPTRAASPTKMNLNADATDIFKLGVGGVQDEVSKSQPLVTGSRKVPQWSFLTRLFSDIFLQDRAAMAAAGASGKTSGLRRLLLLAGSVVCLLLALAVTISYFGNRSLQAEVTNAASLPMPGTLQQLESIRQTVEKLSLYRTEGPPRRLRWWLYKGDELYPHARYLYFSRFHALLFGNTQLGLIKFLKEVPSTPGPGDDYGRSYDVLKAYLMTTSNHDQSSQAFLSPLLMKRWSEAANADPESLLLAQKQFDFYSTELKSANPFSTEAETVAVERARRYLSAFAGAERVYRLMLAEAAQKNPPVAFNRQFAGSSDVLINNKEVPGSFTKAGWSFMQDAIKNAERFFSGEQWVLGAQAVSGIDRAKLEKELKDRYTADFIDQWQQFMRAAVVVRYGGVKDAASKLSKLSSNQTPLLAMFCVASQNTGVDSEPIKTAFQSVQFVVPPTCTDKYIGESNAGYMQSLVGLNALIEQIAGSPGGTNDALTGQAMTSAIQAKVVTRQVAQNFRIDPQLRLESVVQKLMEDPITYAEALVRNVAPAELNGKGKTLCSQFGELTARYPFNPNATRQATLQELSAVFQPPQGALWAFYDANLQKLLLRQGGQFVANPSAGVTLNPAFLTFWNRAASFSDAIYPEGASQPRLVYSLKLYPVPGIDNVTLSIDGTAISTTASNAGPRQFIWSGNPKSEVKLTGALGRGTELAFASYEGLWAPFQFFGDADRWTTSGSMNTLEWVPRQGRAGRPITLPDGSPLTIRFDLDMGRAASVFQKAFLSSLTCTAEIAR